MDDEVERLLADILQYVRASAIAAVRVSARSVVDTDRKAKVYASMTGDRSQQEIASSTGVPQATVSRYQRDFIAAGLAAESGRLHQYARALFSLDELGIPESVISGQSSLGKRIDESEQGVD